MDRRPVILVADDEVMLRDLIGATLRSAGYEVLMAADGAEALELSRAHAGTIDLLLTDIEMPKIDGVSVYRHLIAERVDVKVLFMSGGNPDFLTLPYGTAFLHKPFITLDALVMEVRELLELHPPQRIATYEM